MTRIDRTESGSWVFSREAMGSVAAHLKVMIGGTNATFSPLMLGTKMLMIGERFRAVKDRYTGAERSPRSSTARTKKVCIRLNS